MLFILPVSQQIKSLLRMRVLNQKGQSIIIFAFAFLGLIAMLGLALDLGLVYIERTRIKRAVDAATLAGVVELPNEEKAMLRAIGYLDQNGYRLRDNDGNPQVNVWVRGCAHEGYLQNTNFDNYHDTNPDPPPRETIVRTETITSITVNKTYHLYYPSTGNKVENPKGEFFIDTRSFQSRDIDGNFEAKGQQCNESDNILGTAGKIHMDGTIPVDMNFMQFFGFSKVPVSDEAIAQNVTNLDVVVVFDMSGSMQFDTTCYGCYEPYEWAANNSEDWFEQPPPAPADPDFSIDYPNPAYIHRIPTDHLPSTPYQSGGTAGVGSNAGRLCWNRDSPANGAEHRSISGAGDTQRYLVIEAELYSQNTSRLYGSLRMPDTGYWAIQHTNNRTVADMMDTTGGPYPVGATPILSSYTRSSWVSHHPYVTWAIDNVQPFGHDYTLDEIKNDPNGNPRLEYDFITSTDWDCSSMPNTCSGGSSNDDTRIWARVQGGGGWGTGDQIIYWAVYDYNSLYAPAVSGDVTQVIPLGSGQIEPIRETDAKEGPNYGGASSNKWRWQELTGSDTAPDLANGARYTLIIWPGRVGYDLDQIVIENDDSIAWTSNYDGGVSPLEGATEGSAFRQACNRCNPIYGLTITQTTDCDSPSDNGAYDPFIFVNGNDLSDPAVNPLYGGYQPIRDAKEAVKHFIERLQPQFDQVGIVSYSTETPDEGRMELRCRKRYSAQQCFQGTNPISYTDVLEVVEMLPPNGSTNMAQGMLRGLETLGINSNNVDAATWTASNDCSTATDHCGRGGAARRVMIIMSDGVANTNPWDSGDWPYTPGSGIASENCYQDDLYQPNSGSWSENVAKDCVMYYGQIAANNNVTMYTIGLGNGVDDNLMTTVAELPGSNGEFFKAVSSAELDGIFSSILESITVRLIE